MRVVREWQHRVLALARHQEHLVAAAVCRAREALHLLANAHPKRAGRQVVPQRRLVVLVARRRLLLLLVSHRGAAHYECRNVALRLDRRHRRAMQKPLECFAVTDVREAVCSRVIQREPQRRRRRRLAAMPDRQRQPSLIRVVLDC